jgi:hypothetical protein
MEPRVRYFLVGCSREGFWRALDGDHLVVGNVVDKQPFDALPLFGRQVFREDVGTVHPGFSIALENDRHVCIAVQSPRYTGRHKDGDGLRHETGDSARVSFTFWSRNTGPIESPFQGVSTAAGKPHRLAG